MVDWKADSCYLSAWTSLLELLQAFRLDSFVERMCSAFRQVPAEADQEAAQEANQETNFCGTDDAARAALCGPPQG